jgi:uncharacterized protein
MATPQVSRDKTASGTPAVPRGHFVWYELLANDEAVATAFYSKALGWSTEPWKTPPGAPPYTMWSNAGAAFGGLMGLPKEAKDMGAPSHWLGYVTVPDTDKSLEQAKRLGAKSLAGPMDIPEVGRMAVIADPQGAVLALFTPKMTGSAPPPSPAGTVSWNELATDDGKKAWDFYEVLFGWQKGEAMDMGAMGLYQIFTLGGGRPHRRHVQPATPDPGVELALLLQGRQPRRDHREDQGRRRQDSQWADGRAGWPHRPVHGSPGRGIRRALDQAGLSPAPR